jgi:acetyl-CoA synthetase
MWNWETEAEALGIELNKPAFLNIGYEITDKICQRGFGEKVAVLCKRKSGTETALTFSYLAKESSRFALFLKSLNVVKGDRVFLYSDRVPELYLSIIGVFKSGAILSPLFSSFGPEAIKDRLADGSASTIIVQESLLENVLAVHPALPHLRNIVVISDNTCFQNKGGGIFDFNEYKSFGPTDFCETTCADDSAIIHYTSGTTGKPKGALHAHSAILGHYATSKHVLTLKSDDIYWCTADTAWVTGMSYGVIGPLSNAVTQISVEGNLNTPIILNAIESYKVTVLYTAPTLLRMMMREKPENISRYNTGSLRHIAAVGEALNPEIIKWSRSSFNLPVHDTWFQTETGCIMIANTPENIIKPGSMGKPIPPVTVEILNEDFIQSASGNSGMLAIKPKWPSMFKTYWNREDIYEDKFKNHWYLTGDNARKDEDGYFWFIGRDDDVINTAGHLVSPFEVESALVENPLVAEAAVIGVADGMIGEKIKAFIVLKQEIEALGSLKIELRSYVRNMVSPFAVPQEIEIVENLPKTDSGKVIRRLLRSM